MALISTFLFGGMDNVSDSASVGAPDERGRAYTKCVDLVNCDVDDDLNVSRREGATLITEADVISGWSNGAESFCVSEGGLHRFFAGALVPLGNSPTMQGVTEFCQVNDVVVFSDNATIGYIKETVPYVLNAPAEENDLLDLETWVKLTYPAGKDQDASNFEIDAFKLATFAGRCLEFYNGSLYLAKDNFLYCTKTFNIASMDTRYNVVAGFKDAITMVKRVNDGLFVGTEGGTYFLAGDGVKGSGSGVQGFTQRRISPLGVIYGSAVAIPADKALPAKAANGGVAWLTPAGVYLGLEGGRVEDLTVDQVQIPLASGAAAALRHRNGERHYLVAMNGQAFVVNLRNGAHSRYLNYAFDSFFSLYTRLYGANDTGVFLLEGETDHEGAPIDSAIVSPVADMGSPQLKRCNDALLQVRAAGDMVLDLYTDEAERATDVPFGAPYQIDNGVRRVRAILPRGAKGSTWQFKIRNVDGCRFTAFSLKVNPVELKRTI